jgi:hypothetical protein
MTLLEPHSCRRRRQMWQKGSKEKEEKEQEEMYRAEGSSLNAGTPEFLKVIFLYSLKLWDSE